MPEYKDFEEKSDEELVPIVLKNQDYFVYLIERYKTKLLYYIRRISNCSIEDAEDILQDVFIKTYTNLNNFDINLKFSSWIYRITHNQVISNYRKLKARPQSISLGVDDNFLENIASSLDITKEVELQFLKERIDDTLKKLDIRYREVLVLKFLEEKDYKEISDILKKPMGTVATLINRAKKQFKDKVKKYE
tara:strand:- start:431 stop:1006 length:576 start_codon:yes stop_codon:yes gene_type:complete